MKRDLATLKVDTAASRLSLKGDALLNAATQQHLILPAAVGVVPELAPADAALAVMDEPPAEEDVAEFVGVLGPVAAAAGADHLEMAAAAAAAVAAAEAVVPVPAAAVVVAPSRPNKRKIVHRTHLGSLSRKKSK